MFKIYKKVCERLLKGKHRIRYSVTGNGVANRKAENYLSDPKVRKFLKANKEL